MLWLKALHLIFMVAWFAGIFYLPRLFINHAMTDNPDSIAQFKQMERKLYRFTTPWMWLTLIFGGAMLWQYAWDVWGNSLWLNLKLLLIAVLVGYHFYCGYLVKVFARDQNQRSHRWYRYFNEIPALILFIVIPLAVLKP